MNTPKSTYKVIFTGAATLAAVSSTYAATTFAPISGFDPDTYFSGPVHAGYGVLAGFDFNDSSPTQAGFTGIPASNSTSYNVTNNGVTVDITINNRTTGNQNRDRGAGTVAAPRGDLTRDFEQWYNNSGGQTNGVFSFSGLKPNTGYYLEFYMYNIGSGQTTQSFYDGDSLAAPLITTFTTSGNQNNQATWSPGLTIFTGSDSSGEIDITVLSSSGGRLTINGVAIYVPEPSSTALLGLGGLALMLRRRR